MAAVAGSKSFGSLARDHIARPRNLGCRKVTGRGSITAGEAGSEASGSFVRFHLRVRGGRVEECRYEVLGAPALIASASYASEILTGRTARTSSVPNGLRLARSLGLPRSEHGAALLVEDALRLALTSAPGART